MPIIHVHIIEGRSAKQKSEMARRVTEVVSDSLAAPIESIRVLVHEASAEDWHVAGISKAERESGK